MIATWVVAIVGYLVVMICNFTATQAVAMMADQLNREKPGNEVRSAFGWRTLGWERQRRIVREYRATHPEGNLRLRLVASYIIGTIALVAAVASVLRLLVRT